MYVRTVRYDTVQIQVQYGTGAVLDSVICTVPQTPLNYFVYYTFCLSGP